MGMELNEVHEGRLLLIRVTGKLVKEDFNKVAPEVQRLIDKYGKVQMLLEMHDFHGWTFAALWEDMELGVKHATHISQLAMIGEKRWQRAMATVLRPFTTAEVRYFEPGQKAQALSWLEHELHVKQ